MDALVTGATGYIGTHLCRALLDEGWDVHALVRANSRVDRLPPAVKTHLIDASHLTTIVKLIEPDIVFHLAAFVSSDDRGPSVERIVSDNSLFGVRVLEAMLATSCRRFINTGTYWEYDENGRYVPNTLYAASKRAFQDILVWFAAHHHFAATTLVMFDVYGPDDWRARLLPRLLECMQSMEVLPMTEGDQFLDMVHVRDAAAAYIKAISALPPPGSPPVAWSVATGQPIALRQLVDTFGSLAAQPLSVQWGASLYPSHQIMRPVRTDVLPVLPGWQPSVALKDGLKEILNVRNLLDFANRNKQIIS
jgi:nucleoside-diphosphate-sugar epimerase